MADLSLARAQLMVGHPFVRVQKMLDLFVQRAQLMPDVLLVSARMLFVHRFWGDGYWGEEDRGQGREAVYRMEMNYSCVYIRGLLSNRGMLKLAESCHAIRLISFWDEMPSRVVQVAVGVVIS